MRVDETERLRMASERLQAEVEQLQAEVELLKSHTWEQERAAIVAWLNSNKRGKHGLAVLYANRIERGDHWPTEVEP
jgi:hypothetical protein